MLTYHQWGSVTITWGKFKQDIPQSSINWFSLKISSVNVHSTLPGVNELTRHQSYKQTLKDFTFVTQSPAPAQRNLSMHEWHATDLIDSGTHDDIIIWKHFPCYWPFVQWIHQSLVNSPHEDQWRGALMFSLICAWIKGWVNNHEVGDLRCPRTHYDVTVMRMVRSMRWIVMHAHAKFAYRQK